MAKKVLKKLKEELEKKGLKLSVTENGKEGKSKMIASCLLGGRAASTQQGRRSDVDRQFGNAGCRLENKSQEVGSTRTSEKKEVQSEILACQEEQSLPGKNYRVNRLSGTLPEE